VAWRRPGWVRPPPTLYRAAVEAAAAGIEHLPRALVYNPFNAWGRQREVPSSPPLTFRQWYLKHRASKP
jgi:L-lactate dehydrogenase complex protein LldF